jgi:hypothetical protein
LPDLFTPLQLQRTAGLHVHLDVIGIDLAQRVVDTGVVDLAGGERGGL